MGGSGPSIRGLRVQVRKSKANPPLPSPRRPSMSENRIKKRPRLTTWATSFIPRTKSVTPFFSDPRARVWAETSFNGTIQGPAWGAKGGQR